MEKILYKLIEMEEIQTNLYGKNINSFRDILGTNLKGKESFFINEFEI